MGRSSRDIDIPAAIKLARTGRLESWSTGLLQRIDERKVVRAELFDDGKVALYYPDPKSPHGYRGKGDRELFQEFILPKKKFTYTYVPWNSAIPGHPDLPFVMSLGTIRTVPENYYVADVYKDLSLMFDSRLEAATRNVDRASVRKWWEQNKPEMTKGKMGKK
jgi:hypothetical protein